MKTLFLNPLSFQGFDGGAGSRWQAKREIRSFWYPTWLAQAAALVDGSKLVDATGDDLSIDDVLQITKDYELVIIYTSTPSFTNDAVTAARIKEQDPGVLIGFVGPHVTVFPEDTLHSAPAVDFVVRKEFEYPVLYVSQGQPFSDIRGLSWRDGDIIRHNEDSEIVTDLDSLPSVLDIYKRDLNIDNYYVGYLPHPFLSFYTGRGCPARCTYCLWPQTFLGHHYRVRSPESVYKEMARAKELFPQVKEFFIDDDTFTANLKRAEEIARLLGPLGIVWSTSSRANVPYQTLKVLKENGLRLLMVGYESGDDTILTNVKKGVTTQVARRFTEDCKSLGIALHGCFVVGFPGETPESVERSIKFACEMDPDTIQVAIASPYPGTKFYEQAEENGWLRQEALVASDGTQNCTISYPDMSAEEICAARDRFYKRFYFRPKVMLRIWIQMLKNGEERRRRLREGKEFLSFLKQHKSNSMNKQALKQPVKR